MSIISTIVEIVDIAIISDMRPELKKILYYTAAVTGLSAIFHGLGLWDLLPWHVIYSDVLGFWNRVAEAGFPYVSKNIEYPVLTGLFMEFWGWLGGSRAGYYWLNSAGLILAALVATVLLAKMTKAQLPQKSEVGLPTFAAGRLWQYWILAPSMFVFAVYNWDMLAILFSVAAFYFMHRGNDQWAAVFIALGFSTKFFPVIYLSPLLIQPKPIIDRLKTLGAFLVAAVLVNGYFALANFQGWYYFFAFNSARNSNPDSIWTVARFLFGEISVPTINTASLLIFVVAFGWVLWRYRHASALSLCFAGTILFLLTNKIFSPQYTLWLLPFFVLAGSPSLPPTAKSERFWFYALEFSNIVILFVILRWFLLGQDIIYFYIVLPFILLRHSALIVVLRRALQSAE